MDRHSIARAPSHLGNPDNTQLMDLTTVMPQRIQSARNAHQHQPLPHLPSICSSSHSRPLPSIPSFTWVELHIPSLSSHQNEHHHFSSNNDEQRLFYDMNWPFISHNNQYCPVYDINAHQHHPYPSSLSPQRYPLPTSLPILKEPSTPSSPTYIPILTGRSDCCPWSEALMTAVFGMNLFGHIAEHLVMCKGLQTLGGTRVRVRRVGVEVRIFWPSKNPNPWQGLGVFVRVSQG